VPQGKEHAQDVALERAKVRLAAPGEDLRYGPPLARLDQRVDVFSAPAEPRGKRARHGGLPPP
jgi:hypothetical protein